MGLNLGSALAQAAAALRTDPAFTIIREELHDQSVKLTNQALDSSIEQRVEATAYARAIRDVYIALEASTLVVQPRLIPLPRGTKRQLEAAEKEII